MANNEPISTDVIEKVEPIKLYDSNHNFKYLLEFSRETVKFAEDRGFRIAAFDEGAVVSVTEDLFFYAFRMHHPKISKAETNKILYEELKGVPEGMFNRLVDLYTYPIETLKQTDSDAKNATMTAEF